MPAQQRFYCDDAAGTQLDAGLKHQHKLFARQRLAQIRSGFQPSPGAGLHHRAVIANGVALFVFGRVHGRVGVHDQTSGVIAIQRVRSHANTGGNRQFVLVDHHRLGQCFEQTFCQLASVFA